MYEEEEEKLIYIRKKKYEVIRIYKILYPVSVAYMSIPPIMQPGLSVVPPNCSAVLERSAPMLEPESGQALVTPPAVWSEAPWTWPAVWSRASPTPDGNLKSCDPFPLPEAQAEDPTDPLTHSPSEQTAVHALLGSHQLQASHVVPGTRGSPKRPWRVPRHSHPLLF
jgi:hypothetical protein